MKQEQFHWRQTMNAIVHITIDLALDITIVQDIGSHAACANRRHRSARRLLAS
jgi:hypothetical protein